MAAKTSTRLCAGYTARGKKCRKPIGAKNPSAYCRPEHQKMAEKMKREGSLRGNNSDLPSKRSARTRSTRVAPANRQGLPGVGNGSSGGALYGNIDPNMYPKLSRDNVKAKDADNWMNPMVQEKAMRSATMKAQRGHNDDIMGEMRNILAKRADAKKLWDANGEYKIKDSSGRTIGVITKSDRPNNYSQKKFGEAVRDNPDMFGDADPADYSERTIDAAAMEKKYPSEYDAMRGKGSETVATKCSEDAEAAMSDMYLDRYSYDPIDSGKLKNWRSDYLAAEYVRLAEENNRLGEVIAQDNSDLQYALPHGSYVASTQDGLNTAVKLGEKKGGWSAKNIGNLPPEQKSRVESDPSVYATKFTSASVKRGDKKNGTNLSEAGKGGSTRKVTFRDANEYAG